jgi:hypothetical protein
MSLSHHGDELPKRSKQMDELLRRFTQQGSGSPPPREYPHGRIGAHDEGALVYLVGVDPATGTVVIDFNKPVKSIGLTPADVAALVKSLVAKAREVATEPLVIEV